MKATLRHSTVTLTSDTYTSLLPELDQEVAAAGPSAHASLTHEPGNDAAPEPTKADPDAA